jgi:mono/diheme cytochrome c family protein
VLDVLTALGADGSVVINTTFPGVLPVDVAVSPDGSAVAAVAPGNAFTPNLDTVFVFSTCGVQQELATIVAADGTSEQPIAVAFAAVDRLLVQTRQPAELHVYDSGSTSFTVALSSVSREDTGHAVFHTQAGGMIACASCHPEGRDDGHVWLLDGNTRRTPSLQGTIAGTAPYHWPGDEADLNVLVNDVYTVRMGGVLLPDDQRTALNGWVQTVPPPPASPGSSASQRGRALFTRADVGCATCHSGPKFTNNATMDVGTGGAFQVPPLVGVAWRAPLMHDGCAATLADRFGACATPGHGSIGALSQGDIAYLVAYLETL